RSSPSRTRSSCRSPRPSRTSPQRASRPGAGRPGTRGRGSEPMGLSTGSKGGAGGSGFRDINVTPLVDVMLVLLIVFMVTAPLLVTGLHIDLPDVTATNTPIKDAKLVVSITKDEKILFGETDVTANVEQVLLTNPRVQSEHEVYIQADKD